MVGSQHRLKNIGIASAAAQIAGQIFADSLRVGVWVFVHQSNGGQDKSGGAVGALESGMVDVSLLDRVKVTAVSQTLNRRASVSSGLGEFPRWRPSSPEFLLPMDGA